MAKTRMRLGTIAILIGLVLAGLGSLWFWQIMKVAVAFAGTGVAINLQNTTKIAGGVVFLGLALMIMGVAALVFTKDDGD